MFSKRKHGVVEEMEEEGKLWEKANPYFIERRYLKPEGYCEAPLYTSVN